MRPAFLILLANALASWGLWLAEVRWVKGWAGLAWLSGFNWSAFPICLLIGAGTTLWTAAAAHTAQQPPRRTILCALTVACACLLAFTLARCALFEMFSAQPLGLVTLRDHSTPMLALLTALVIVAVAPVAAANRWLGPLHLWTAPVLALTLLLVLPLSLATIHLLPALNGITDEIHAIKMGYPVFWTTLLMPMALGLGSRKAHATPKAAQEQA